MVILCAALHLVTGPHLVMSCLVWSDHRVAHRVRAHQPKYRKVLPLDTRLEADVVHQCGRCRSRKRRECRREQLVILVVMGRRVHGHQKNRRPDFKSAISGATSSSDGSPRIAYGHTLVLYMYILTPFNDDTPQRS